MAEWVYEELLSSETIDADAVAYALDGAVQKLRAMAPAPQRWAQFVHVGAWDKGPEMLFCGGLEWVIVMQFHAWSLWVE
jgi:hypothetical protein